MAEVSARKSRLIIGGGGGAPDVSLLIVEMCQRFLDLFSSHNNSVVTLFLRPVNLFLSL